MEKIYYLALPEREGNREKARRITSRLRREGYATVNPFEIGNADISRLSDLLLACDGLILAGAWREDEFCLDCVRRAERLRLEIVEKSGMKGLNKRKF